MNFLATVHSGKIDKDGEFKITFTVPKSDAMEAMAVSALTERVLEITVKPQESNSSVTEIA